VYSGVVIICSGCIALGTVHCVLFMGTFERWTVECAKREPTRRAGGGDFWFSSV